MRSIRAFAVVLVGAGLFFLAPADVGAADAASGNPEKPKVYSAAGGVHKATLRWKKVKGAGSYEVYQGTTANFAIAGTSPLKSDGPATEIVVPDLKAPGPYFFKVVAVSSDGQKRSAASDAVKVTVLDFLTAAGEETVQAFFQSGVSLLNPYHVNVPPAGSTDRMTIGSATNTDANAFLEFVFGDRLAWNGERILDWQNNDGAKAGEPFWFFPKQWFHGKFAWDVEARIGYTFAGGSEETTASTIVGSGNFNAELTAGLPVILMQSPSGGNAFTVGLEFGYGAVTERSALRAHESVFAGLAYNAAFTDPVGEVKEGGSARRALLNFRMLVTSVDTVRYVDEDSRVIHTRNGLPRYFSKWTLAFQSQLLYPINDASYVTFSGRVYPDLTPGLWSVQIGLTVLPTKIMSSLFPE